MSQTLGIAAMAQTKQLLQADRTRSQPSSLPAALRPALRLGPCGSRCTAGPLSP